MKYFVIGDEDTVLGFGMVGVDGRVAGDVAEAEAAFDAATADPDVGILVVTERAAELIRPRVDRYLFSDTFPLIVEIPDRSGRMTGRPTIRETVNSAIGIKLG
ncbi:MAG: Vacuolar H+transporting two-sector ATPase F subunit [Spirochaetae bacterium HGW-Spirochaetae-3]|nr:MAG: Vacuolar H+transporting two-sector ATPase F subunit [Spirochaetae bacterium HGW-Spirochaetae-3]